MCPNTRILGEKYHISFLDCDMKVTMTRIGDCDAPAIVAAATYAGHKFARELEEITDPDQPLKHERIDVGLAIAANLQSAVKF